MTLFLTSLNVPGFGQAPGNALQFVANIPVPNWATSGKNQVSVDIVTFDPLSGVIEAKFPWTVVRDNLLKMAEKMPAENYSFEPTPQIESFGQRLAHIAGANLFVCQGVMAAVFLR
jgi:hypothetical protein